MFTAEDTIKIVLLEEQSFSKTQLVKATFSTIPKNTFEQWHLFIGNFRSNHYFIVFPEFDCFGPPNVFGHNR